MSEVINGNKETQEVSKTEDVATVSQDTEETKSEPLIAQEDIDFLMKEIFNNQEEKVIRPTFNDSIKKEEEKPTEVINETNNESVDEISEEEILEIESQVDEIIKELEDVKTERDELASKLSTRDSELELKVNEINEKISEIDMLKKAIDTLGEHEVIGPIAKKIFSGEEVDIPNFLKDYVSKDKSMIPNLDSLSNEGIQKKSKNPTMDDYVMNISKFNKFKI